MKIDIKENIALFLKAGAIGVANIIPGVSGGTIAVVLGLYDRLIESIAFFFEARSKRKEYAIFLLKVAIGAGSAILLLARAMDYLLANHHGVTIFAFLGLIVGGIPSIWNSHGDMRFSPGRFMSFMTGVILVIAPSLMFPQNETSGINPGSAVIAWSGYLVLLLSGFLAGGGMIIPGISGSFILVLMGQYSFIIYSIKEFNITPLVFVAIGAASGIFVFSKIIESCLQKIPALTYYFILGLVAASCFVIFPGLPKSLSEGALSAATFICGIITSYFMSKIPTSS